MHGWMDLTFVNFNLELFGSQTFAVSAPELWNCLPDRIHSCDNKLSTFKSKLKTWLRPSFLKMPSILRGFNFNF